MAMSESIQERGLSAAMSDLSKQHGEAAGSGRVKQARHAATQYRGVHPKPSGRYGAQIWVPSRRGKVWLGTFDTAEEAAKEYAAAAGTVELQTAGRAGKNTRNTAARPDTRTEFRGVQRTLSGKYGAQIGHSGRKSWLGTFDAAEDAARAYDAAAVKLHGAKAITNFSQSSEDEDVTAETVAVKKEEEEEEEESMDLLNDFLEMPAFDFLLHNFPDDAALLDDLWAGLPPAERQRQLVDGFLKDSDFPDVVP